MPPLLFREDVMPMLPCYDQNRFSGNAEDVWEIGFPRPNLQLCADCRPLLDLFFKSCYNKHTTKSDSS